MGAWEDGFKAGWRERDDFVSERGGMRYQANVRSSISKKKPAAGSKARSPRKLTAYNRFMKGELKRQKKAHPRMKQPAIMKRAAKAWRAKKRRK